MNLKDARTKLPNFAHLDDAQFVDAVHRTYYSSMDRDAFAAQLGYKPEPAAQEGAGVFRTIGDVGIKAAQGVVDLGAAAVGVGNLVTGGLVGEGMQAIGYDPKATNAALGEYLSDSQKAADEKVANADGFVATVAESLRNPRSILGAVAQSAPGMAVGMGVSGALAGKIGTRAALASTEGAAANAARIAAGGTAAEGVAAASATAAGKKAAQEAIEAAGTRLIATGAAVEGLQGAGKIAHDAEAAGRDYTDYVLPALGAGAGTALIGLGAGKLMGDSATKIATGAQSSGVKGGMAARVGKEMLSEGVLEEMPQSAQEQVFTNIAMGEDALSHVGNAAGAGLVTGAAMGGGLGLAQGRSDQAPAPTAAPVVLPNTGPLSQAANAGQAAAAAIAPAPAAPAAAPAQPAAPVAEAADSKPVLPLEAIDKRLDELRAIGRGTPAHKTMGIDGWEVNVDAVPPRPHTDAERAEYHELIRERRARVAIPPEQLEEFNRLVADEESAKIAAFEQRLQTGEQAPSWVDEKAAKEAEAKAEVERQIAAMLEEERAQQQARERAEMDVTNAIVEHERQARAAERRAAVLDSVLADTSIPSQDKEAAFARALAADGYRDTTLTDADRATIAAATAPLPSLPNELVDAVPERAAPGPKTAETNTASVDEAIAKGMRLKIQSGNVLHKPGSSKLFRLSTAQKAYYLERMAQLASEEAAPAIPVAAAVVAPAPVDPAAQAADPAEQLPDQVGAMQEAPEQAAIVSAIDEAAHQAATSPMNELPEPTQAQKEAGNYAKGHVRLHGLDISIENPKGSKRAGVDKDGTAWENEMQSHYGYIRGTVGADKDHIDVFVGDAHDSGTVYIVDQVDPASGKFDEHKVMLGYPDIDAARAAYLASYAEDWNGGQAITPVPLDGFKDWLASGRTRKAYAGTRQAAESQPVRLAPAAITPEAPAANDPAPLPRGLAKARALKAVKADPASATLRDDFGVEHIDGYDGQREDGTDGIKGEFLADAKNYLNAVAKVLAARGWLPPVDGKGRTEKPVRVNAAGIAVSGEVYMNMAAPDSTYSAHVEVSGGVGGMMMPSTKSGVTLRYVLRDGRKPGWSSANNWADPSMSAGAFADTLQQLLERHEARADQVAVSREPNLAPAQPVAPTVEPTVAPAAPAAEPTSAPTTAPSAAPAPTVTKAELAKLTVKDMADDVLLQAQTVLADTPRAKKVAAEIARRGLTTNQDAVELAAQDTPGEKNDDRNPGSASPTALDGVPAAEDGGSSLDRPIPGSRENGGGAGAAADRGTDGAGRETARSGGSGPASVHPPATGGGKRARLGGRGTGRDRGAVPGDDARASAGPDTLGVDESPSAPNVPAQNFRITDDIRLGKGGEVEKFNDNLAAIRVLQAVERERRRATPDEQAILARYVGWGGLASAFPSPETNQFKDGWAGRGQELQALLSPPEYAQARRSTLDSHYTAQPVVQAMWDAARHLGYGGGLVLESSMGTGNFLGLIPQQLAASTRFVGVELDGLTARIARQLYPQATVLQSGFQDVPLADGAFDLAIGNPPFGDQSLTFQHKPELRGLSIHNQFFVASLDAVKPGGLQIMVVSRYLMDAKDSSARRMLATRAKLLGAIRLPDTAFKENARTSVVTDILFLQRHTLDEETAAAEAIEAAFANPRTANDKRAADEALAALPSWIQTGEYADPLGGEALTVNRYFIEQPGMVIGTMDRSGKNAFRTDLNVHLADPASLPERLADAIAQLPAGVMQQDPNAIAASIARHQGMSDALEIALQGHETGAIRFNEAGELEQMIERETPEGGYELAKRVLTAATPWSDRLYQAADGRYYTMEVQLDGEGKAVKQEKDGKATNLNVYVRNYYASAADIPESMRLGATRLARLSQLVNMRDLLKTQLTMEAANEPDQAIEDNRRALAQAYSAYTKRHGWVSDPVNMSLVTNMPDGALILALEVSYRPAISEARAAAMGEAPRKAAATPAPILSKRVIVPYQAPETATGLADALAINLAEAGRVNVPRLASLLGKTEAEVEADLSAGEKPLAFKDPETGRWETRDAYLSGQVRRKLNAARAAGLMANVQALEAVQPEAWGAESVTAILGATWIPGDVYADFVKHLSGGNAVVTFSALTNSFDVRAQAGEPAREEEWGTPGYSASDLVAALLNSSQIRVTYPDKDGNPVLHREHTDLALLKARAVANEFADWVYADGERRARLVAIFNEKFNTRVTRQHDGSHLVLPGKVPDAVISMRRHQKNAIWRGIVEPSVLYDHQVGAGKTFTGIARAMERRRMGLSQKPAIIVPNHMVEQFTADVYRLYPGAKVLAAGKKDFEKARRRRLFAKIATGDWDIVIIPHSSFGFIGIAPETEERYLQAELKAAMDAIEDAQKEAEANGHTSWRKPVGVKEAERLVERLEERLKRVRSQKATDRLLTFEQMGIDDLTVDEAHEFKNLAYTSHLTGVKGMGNKTGSAKAFDLYNKVRVLREMGGSVAFMTGTPISNSAVEMYTMMRYLAADQLDELGLTHFDAWRAQYVSTDSAWEPTETGRLKEVNRLGRTWSNMRSLMDLYYSFTDSVGNDDIKRAYAEDNGGAAFPIPRVKGGDRQSIIVPPTRAQVAMLEAILDGFDNLPDIEDPFERNKARLRLMDRARKVSLDVRAVEPSSTSREEGGKLEVIADQVKRIYDKWDADRGTQLIFLDRSVPKAKGDDAVLKEYDALLAAQRSALDKQDEDALRAVSERLERFDANEMESLRAAQSGGWNAYQQIKDNLIARGIPANEIRFIQEADTDAKKQALFDAVNDGTVRVLLGSTPRMGAGTNVQKRLVAIHHADVTWKPSDIEQREGRGVRQGNSLLEKYGMDGFEIELLAYATERTIDAKMWSLNAAKLRTINAIRMYDGAFSMDFDDEDSVSMAELAALASGDPLLLERVKLMADIDRLELLKRQHQRKEWAIVGQIEDAQRLIATAPGRIQLAEADAQAVAKGWQAVQDAASSRTVKVEGQNYSDGAKARLAVNEAIQAQQKGDNKAKFSVQVGGRRLTSLEGAMNAITAALGDATPFAMSIGDAEHAARTDAARAIAEQAAKASRDLDAGGSAVLDLGQFLGMPLQGIFERGQHGYYGSIAVLRPDGSTLASGDTNIRENAEYNTMSMRTALDNLEKALAPEGIAYSAENLRARLARGQEALPGLLAKRGGGYPQQAELEEKHARLADVVRQLSSPVSLAKPGVKASLNPWFNADGSARRAAPVPGAQYSRTGSYFRDDAPLHLPPAPVTDNGTEGFAELAEALTGKELAEAQRQVTRLNRFLASDGQPAAKVLRQAPNAQFALARYAASLFNIPVNYIARHEGFEGVAYEGVAYLAEGMPNPVMAIAGHEAMHALEQQDPDMGRRLRERVRAHLKAGAVELRQFQESAASGFAPVSIETAEGELLADIAGSLWMDPTFWADMAKTDAGLFRRAAYLFLEVATKLINALRSKRFDVSQLVDDVDAVRAAMVEAWSNRGQALAKQAPPVFSKADSSIPVAGAEGLPVLAVYEEVEKLVGNFAHQPTIIVRDRFSASENEGRSAVGATDKGRIYLFRDRLSSREAVRTTLFHELLHYGLRRFLSEGEYVARMMELYQADSYIKQEADAWAAGSDGKAWAGWVDSTGGNGATMALARGVDEALATLAEPNAGQYLRQGAYIRAIRSVNAWMARLASAFGLHQLAAKIRARSNREARELIQQIFAKLREDAPAPLFDVGTGASGDFSRLAGDVLMGAPTGALAKHADYAAAKAGDSAAALRLVQDVIPVEFVNQLRQAIGDADVILQPVLAREATGHNKIPAMAAEVLAQQLGVVAGDAIVQASTRKRTGLTGLDRVFNRPTFDGPVDTTRPYFLLDDTLTQGGTLAALAAHIRAQGGTVIGMGALTGKAYSAKIELSPSTLSALREKFGDIEQQFRQATGYGFDALTESEARYLANFSPADTVRARILALGHVGQHGVGARAAEKDPVSGPRGAYSRVNLGEALASAANNVAELRLPANYLVGDLFNRSGKLSWWHKTIGTMDNLARRHPAFARVYEAVQAFIGDVSRFATVPADLAPSLLPKLETLSDILGAKRKKALTAEDTRAIGAPIFEGTLMWARDANGVAVKVAELEAEAAKLTVEQKAQILLHKGIIDEQQNRVWLHSPIAHYENIINSRFENTQLKPGVVWTDAELRGNFGLNDGQIALYREFRAALDKSLGNLAITEMVKLGGKEAKHLLEEALSKGNVQDAGLFVRDYFVKLAQDYPDQATMHLDTANQVMNTVDKAQDLMDRGYAPLTRFGKYTVYVQDGEEQLYFGMFETAHEASRMARQMKDEHPGAQILQGTMSEDAYKLFAGVSPETIELFGSMVGLGDEPDAASTEVYQAYLKLAKNNRSAMKRMIHRKGIAGFSEDAGRVLASFIYSNARLAAGNAHVGEIDEAITEIPKQQGELTDAAMQLREHIKNPAPSNALSGLMFAQFLGGSVASALINMTQPFTMSVPFLSQWGGFAKASRRVGAAFAVQYKDTTGDADLDKALKWAADEGIVEPQEVHFLQAQAAGRGALRSGDGTTMGNARAHVGNAMAKVQLGWGKLFAVAERLNRRTTFIAAYRTAVEEGIVNPARFAQDAVMQTQGVYNTGNKPKWARGTVGGLLLTFKQYSITYLELLTRMATAGAPGSAERKNGQRAALYMIAVLLLMAGADGLPFEQDIEDAIDGILQRLGYNYSVKREKQAFLSDVLGQGGAQFVLKGVSATPGMPIDVAGRFGMGNLLPGTGLLTKKQSYTQDLGELAGPAGDLVKRAFSASGKLLGGDIGGAALEISPVAVRNLAKGGDMLATGSYQDARGYKVNDVSGVESVLKMAGFQPNSTAAIQDAKGQALNMIAQTRMRTREITEHWAQGIVEGDTDMIREAREWRDDWNAKNPEAPVKVHMPGLRKRVQAMRQDVANRTLMTAPKAVKAAVRSELAEGSR